MERAGVPHVGLDLKKALIISTLQKAHDSNACQHI